MACSSAARGAVIWSRDSRHIYAQASTHVKHFCKMMTVGHTSAAPMAANDSVPDKMSADTRASILVRQNAISPGNGTAMIFFEDDGEYSMTKKRNLSSFIGHEGASRETPFAVMSSESSDDGPCSAHGEVAGVEVEDSADPSIITYDPVMSGLARINHGDSMIMDARTLASLHCALGECEQHAAGVEGAGELAAHHGQGGEGEDSTLEQQAGGCIAQPSLHSTVSKQAVASTRPPGSCISSYSMFSDASVHATQAASCCETVEEGKPVHGSVDTPDVTEGAHAVPHVSKLARYPRITDSSDSEDDSMCVSSLHSEASVSAGLGLGESAVGEGGDSLLRMDEDSPKARVHPAAAASNAGLALVLQRERACSRAADAPPSKLWTARTEDPGASAQGTGDPTTGTMTGSAASRRRSVFAVVVGALSLRRASKVARAASADDDDDEHEAPPKLQEDRKRRPSLVQRLFSKPRRHSAPTTAGSTAASLPKAAPMRPRASSMPQGIAVSLRSTAPSKWATVPTTPTQGTSAAQTVQPVQGEQARLAALPRYSPQNPFVGLASLVRTASSAASFYRSVRLTKVQQAVTGQTSPA